MGACLQQGGSWGRYIAGAWAHVCSRADHGVGILQGHGRMSAAGRIMGSVYCRGMGACLQQGGSWGRYIAGAWGHVCSRVDHGVSILQGHGRMSAAGWIMGSVYCRGMGACLQQGGSWGQYIAGAWAHV